jgi:hypothetical protein
MPRVSTVRMMRLMMQCPFKAPGCRGNSPQTQRELYFYIIAQYSAEVKHKKPIK